MGGAVGHYDATSCVKGVVKQKNGYRWEGILSLD